MLTYDLSKRKNIPLYEYLYQCIRNDILNGTIKAGLRLPSKRSLAKHLDISVVTVENAYAQLILEGYVHTLEKSGYFVMQIDQKTSHVKKAASLPPEDEFEYSYFTDFRSNRNRRNNFPFSIWARLVRDTLSAHKEDLMKTVPYNGIFELRAALCDFLHSFKGMDVTPQQIFIGSGTEYLYGRLIQLMGNDKLWAVEKIGTQKISQIFGMYQVKWKYVSMDENGLDPDSLRHSKCSIIHTSPANHFPTGSILPIRRRQELLTWAGEGSGRYIIEDDYDSEFRYSGSQIAPLYTMDQTQSRVIYMNTFSKTLMPSLRISYMILPVPLLEKYQKQLSFYSGTVPSIEQYTLARFISEGYFERHLNHMKNYYRNIKNALIEEIKNSPLGTCSAILDTASGTHFLLKLFQNRFSDSELTDRLRSVDIETASLSEYDTDSDGFSSTLVINYCGIHEERIHETVMRMCQVLMPFDTEI